MKQGFAIAIVMAAAVSLLASDAPARQARQPGEGAHVAGDPLLAQARQALFEDSQLDRARQLAQEELRQNPAGSEALFVEMEAAALEADSAAELSAALKLCESRSAWRRDPRADIAAGRLLALAANTEDFRSAIPRIEALLAAGQRRGETHPHAAMLRAALVAAAADGAPGINLEKAVRESGLMREWRVAGPFGHYANLEFDQHWAPERDSLLAGTSDGHAVERLHFDDGMFRLPPYFSQTGVLYAAAEAKVTERNLMVRVESPGTLEVLVDGAVVLRKDDRFRVTPEIAWRTLSLRPGTHRVVVKFLASAAPFRVALVPTAATLKSNRVPEIEYAPEANYVAAAQKYWSGDYHGVISSLAGVKARASATSTFLLYRAWAHLADDSPEENALLTATLQTAPQAVAAEYEMAARALAADRMDEAVSRLQRVIGAREDFLPAQQLLAQIAARLNWTVLTEKTMEFQLRVHPSCDVLLQGYKFFAGHARYEKAHELQRRLADCAPDTLSYVQSLDISGEHEQAAAAAEALVARYPLDRGARELLLRELVLSAQTAKARSAAADLAALAPNSSRYVRMAQLAASNVEAQLDEVTLRNPELARDGAFYSKFRRDGVQMVAKTSDRRFSGGPAVVLVNDRVARLGDDGGVSVYIHKLTRVLDRDGIEKYGEVEIPRGAQVLELRTIKADGSVAEPELTPQKATVSMPALAAGNAIDEEYVVHFPRGGVAAHAKEFRHVFGSFLAPIMYSRFAAITPASEAGLHADVAPGIVAARVETMGSERVRIWEKNDLPQSVEEVSSARGEVLPSVRLEQEIRGGWNEVRDRFRNQLVDAVRIGPRVERMAAQLKAREPQARAREIFRTIANSVRPAGGFNPEDMPSAEETLAAGSGSRAIAVLAVARAAGLDAELVLARDAGAVVRDTRASLSLYARPLLRFRFADGREMFADTETEGLAFGALPPAIERHDALLVPALRENGLPSGGAILASLPTSTEEQSVADANVTVNGDGSLRADVTIRMGAWRGAQMRTILAGIEPSQRTRFYQQLASRIFAGADEVTGSTRNESDPDQALEIVLHCSAPRYVNLGQNTAEIDQLVPTLGLKKMYAGVRRRYPLYIDTPLVESATFHVHLPAGLTVVRTLPELRVSGAFGSYTLILRQPSPEELDIQRSFHVPAQVIMPERFADFSAFASKIEEVERQRITLQRN